jgi:phage repressor protein C with HTH and peptisase S24 domain
MMSTDNYGEGENQISQLVLMSTLGSRIKKAREEAKLSQAALAKEFNISRNAVSLWESDENAPTADKIGRIALLTGVSAEYLMSGKEHSFVQKPDIPSPFDMPRDVPVRGTATGGEDGAFVFESTIIDYVRRPPRLRGIAEAYALYVQGHSMSPWREPGSTIYVHPKQPVAIGDYVVVQIGTAGRPTGAYIKRLVRRTATEIRLKQYDPPEEVSFATKRVISIHRVLDWSELMGL